MKKQEGVSRVKDEALWWATDANYREGGGCGLWWMLMGGGELQALGARSHSAGCRSTRGVGDSVAEEDAEGEKQASPSLDLRKRGPGFRRTPMTCGGCRGEEPPRRANQGCAASGLFRDAFSVQSSRLWLAERSSRKPGNGRGKWGLLGCRGKVGRLATTVGVGRMCR